MKSKFGILIALASLLVVGARAETTGETGQSVEALAFITGSWQGPLFGGQADETWLPPRDGTMVGVFRLTWPETDRKIYELFLVEESDDGQVVMTFRHFSPLMELWEREVEKPNMFVLAEAGERMATFDAPDKSQKPARLIFLLSDDEQTLTIKVQAFDEEGALDEGFDAVYTRAESP